MDYRLRRGRFGQRVSNTRKVFGAHVVAIDINDEKLAFAKESGADLVINAAKDAAKVIQEKPAAHAQPLLPPYPPPRSTPPWTASVQAAASSPSACRPNLWTCPSRVWSWTASKWSARWSVRAKTWKKPSIRRRRLGGTESPTACFGRSSGDFQEMREGKITGRMVIDMKKNAAAVIINLTQAVD